MSERTRTVVLPTSRLSVVYRKPGGFDRLVWLGGLDRAVGSAAEAGDVDAIDRALVARKLAIQDNAWGFAQLIAACCVEPRFTISHDPEPGVMSILDLDELDYVTLMRAIKSWEEETTKQTDPSSATVPSS